MLAASSPDRIQIAFDDDRLVDDAGLLLPATLAGRLGLRELAEPAPEVSHLPVFGHFAEPRDTGGRVRERSSYARLVEIDHLRNMGEARSVHPLDSEDASGILDQLVNPSHIRSGSSRECVLGHGIGLPTNSGVSKVLPCGPRLHAVQAEFYALQHIFFCLDAGR